MLPPHPEKRQGGRRSRSDDRATLAAILYVLESGCSRRKLPGSFPVHWRTTHRRFAQWVASPTTTGFGSTATTQRQGRRGGATVDLRTAGGLDRPNAATPGTPPGTAQIRCASLVCPGQQGRGRAQLMLTVTVPVTTRWSEQAPIVQVVGMASESAV
ncbi:transposase [Micromonospora sp. CA-111912]|uniref:transposase n=1 Tax=Micromonospora sp. CA-111912 TaxID=3239955 RepID=UPI003D918C0E